MPLRGRSIMQCCNFVRNLMFLLFAPQTHGNGKQKVLMVIGFGCCKRYWYPAPDLLLGALLCDV